MVFVELKSYYVNEVAKSTPGLTNFINYIFCNGKSQKEIQAATTEDLNSITLEVDSLIRILVSKNSDGFNKFCEQYKRKTPDQDSSWINNNYLIYLIIVGSFQHKADLAWLKPILELRKTTDNEAQLIKDLLMCIVAGQVTQKLAPFSISFFWMGQIRDQFNQLAFSAKETLASIMNFPAYSNEFLNLLQMHSFTVLLQTSSIVNLDQDKIIESFRSKFERRISVISTVASYILIIGILITCYFLLKHIFSIVPQSTKDWILIFLSLLGFTGLEILKGRKIVANRILIWLSKFFGMALLNHSK